MTRTLVAHGQPTAIVGVPVIEATAGIPPWLTSRGSDVRCFDIGAGREVYGPGHTYATPDDIVVTNGLLRFQVGLRNRTTYLAVDAYKDGAWRDKGYLWLSLANTLAGARIAYVTPERACCVLSTRAEGEVFVWLHRGERMLRITHGSTRAPAVSCDRIVDWRSAAPAAPSIPTTGFGFGAFGSGPFGGTGIDPRLPGSPLSGGRLYEATTDGGATRAPDAVGLTRAVAVLRSGATRGGLGVRRFTTSFDVGAYIATTTTGDDLADYHAQLAAASEQDLRLR